MADCWERKQDPSRNWFFSQLKDCGDTAIISDRDKGLEAAENDLEYANYVFCVQHLAENVRSRFGIEARREFIALAYARTKKQYNDGMDSHWRRLIEMHMYISIDLALWATPFVTGRRKWAVAKSEQLVPQNMSHLGEASVEAMAYWILVSETMAY